MIWKITEKDIAKNIKIDFIDISRAFFQADAIRNVYVELPLEDQSPGMCGKLLKSMYGTRDAAQNWGMAYTDFMESIGFVKGKSSPCTFYNQKRELRCVVHGDDFTTVGSKKDLDWFKKELENKYELKEAARLGPASTDDKEGRVLNRIVRWTD